MTEAAPAKPSDNRVAPPSVLRRHGSQLGIIGVGLAMWLSFVIAAPTVFTNVNIYAAFAQTTPQFGIIALALTFVVITGEIDLSFPSIMALGTAAFALVTAYAGGHWVPRARRRLRHRGALRPGQRPPGRQAQHPVARHHHRHLLPLPRARARADERHRRAADRRPVPGDARGCCASRSSASRSRRSG